MNRNKKECMKDILYDFAGAFLQALGIWCFIEPCMIAPGGVSGMALLINHLTKFPVGIMTLILNIPLLISSYVCLNRRMTKKTIQTVFIMSLVLDGLVAPLFPQYIGDKLISSVFGGILAGVGMALIFMRDSTTGGGDILAKLLQKRFPYMHTGYALMIIDVVVIGVSVLVFGKLEAALYGLISMVATTQTIDAILYGMNKGAMVMIHSEKNREIADEIMERLNRGTTFFKSMGGYSKKEGETLLCVIDRKQFYLIKEIAYAHDPRAFVVVSETKETYGEGFLDIR
ncbi:MAG: YitT family protein [Lachnospiraceae bacterium]|nr:YitT family protein [Lachnospiraceae bacterium]MCI9282895.1 YitT family protein [Lachnospiraceae bacterium]